jgi:hypothetical protein
MAHPPHQVDVAERGGGVLDVIADLGIAWERDRGGSPPANEKCGASASSAHAAYDRPLHR